MDHSNSESGTGSGNEQENADRLREYYRGLKTPAFSWFGNLNECPTINLGMSLRDYFAAKAMAAIICNPEIMREIADESDRIATAVSISAQAYIAADAMLAERAK